MSDGPKKGYDVGYGKPPKSHRFRKGQPSPNPHGRPKKKASLLAAVQECLDEKVPVTLADGKMKRMKKAEVIAAKITNDAVSGRIQSQRLIVSLEQKSSKFCPDPDHESSETQQMREEQEKKSKEFLDNYHRLLDNFSIAKFSGMFDNGKEGRLFPTPLSKPLIELLDQLKFSQIRDVTEFKACREETVQKMLEALNDYAFKCLRPWNYGLQKSDLE